MRMIHFGWSIFLLWLALALGACGGGSSSEPEATRIDVTSDRSVILTNAGDQAQVSAQVVDKDGTPVEGAEVRWTSSDPSAVEVTEMGALIARKALGSAVLTAEYQGIKNIVTAVVVTLRPETTLVATEHVISVSDDVTEIRLKAEAPLRSLTPGDIVVNGNENGFLSRVLAVEVIGEEVVLEVADATIPEAVLEMELSAQSPAVTFEDEITSDSSGQKQKSTQIGSVASSIEPECKILGTPANIRFDGLQFNPNFNLSPRFKFKIEGGKLTFFEVALQGTAELKGGIGAVRFRGGLRGQIKCSLSFSSIPFLPVVVFGPLALSATATPNFGVTLEAQFILAELKLNGISLHRGEKFRVGFGYRKAGGFYTIGEHETTADSVDIAKLDRQPEEAFTGKIEPSYGFKLGIGALVGPKVIGKADLVSTKLIAGVEMKLAAPLSFMDPGYTGPSWQTYAGANADIQPLVDRRAYVTGLLARVGLSGLAVPADVKIFEYKQPLWESPHPTVTSDPSTIAVGSTATIQIEAKDADIDRAVHVWAFKDGAASRLLTDRLDVLRSASQDWGPGLSDMGVYELNGLLFDDIFGDVDLPYASKIRPTVEVTDGEDTDPPPGDDCWGPDGTGAGWLDGASFFEETNDQYTFTSMRPSTSKQLISNSTYSRSTHLWTTVTTATYSDGSFDEQTFESVQDSPRYRPKCDENGVFIGGSGTKVTESDTFTHTITWKTGGCHRFFGLGRTYVCEYVPPDPRYGGEGYYRPVVVTE